MRAPLRFSVGDDPRMNANCCPTYVCAVACTVSRSNETSSLLDGYVRTTITIILKLRMGEDEERSREHRSTFFSCILLILLPTIVEHQILQCIPNCCHFPMLQYNVCRILISLDMVVSDNPCCYCLSGFVI